MFPVERGLARAFAGHIHWRAAGKGPAAMIKHINRQSSAQMLELLPALAADFRAVAIDYPGHGHSDPFDGQPTIEDYGRAAIEVMDALGAGWKKRIGRVVAVDTPYFEKGGNDVAHIVKVHPMAAAATCA